MRVVVSEDAPCDPRLVLVAPGGDYFIFHLDFSLRTYQRWSSRYPYSLYSLKGRGFCCILPADMLEWQQAQPCQRLAVIPTIPDEGRWCYGYIFGAVPASYVARGICRSDHSDLQQKKMTALTSK